MPPAVLRALVAAVLAGLGWSAGAQTVSTEPAKPENLERAQKQADAVFRWIKIHADKPAAAPAPPKPAPAPAPVAAKRPAPPTPSAAPRPAANEPVVALADTPAASEPSADATSATPAPAADLGPPVVVAAAAPTAEPSAAVQTAVQASADLKAAEPDAEEPLRLISKVEPSIPRQLARTLTTGIAQVRFTIEPDGRVSQASTLKASHYRLGVAAVEAIKQWRFAPVKKAQEVAIEISFNNLAEE